MQSKGLFVSPKQIGVAQHCGLLPPCWSRLALAALFLNQLTDIFVAGRGGVGQGQLIWVQPILCFFFKSQSCFLILQPNNLFLQIYHLVWKY